MVTQVAVQPYNVVKALYDLRRKTQRECVTTKYKLSQFHEPNSAKKLRKKQESDRRRRKNRRASAD
jgi:small subunit ribosomal protein S21